MPNDLSGKDVLALDGVAFCDAWRDLSDEAKEAMDSADRAAAIARYRETGPSADVVNIFDRSEPGVPRGRAASRAPTSSRLPRVSLDDATMPVAQHGPVSGLIEAGGLVLVVGAPKCGKTFFTIDLAGHVAAGLSWRGRETSGEPVIYIAAEAGRSILRRFIAWRERKLPDSHEGRVPLEIITRAVNLMSPDEVALLLTEIQAVTEELGRAPGIVVYDTLSRSLPGANENDSETMTRLVGVADTIRDRFGAASIIVHHVGKDQTKGGRGHSSLTAAADLVLSVENKVAKVEASRDGEADGAFPFKLEVAEVGLDVDGNPITTCIAMPTDEVPMTAPKGREPKGVAAIGMTSLREAIEYHGEPLPATSAIPHAVRATTIARWAGQFKVRYGDDGLGERSDDAIRQAFKRAREALLGAGDITIYERYVWPTRRV